MGFNDLKKSVQDGTTNSTESTNNGDYDSTPLLKLFPEVVLSFDEVTDLWQSENQWGVSIGFSVSNPQAITLDDVVSEVYMSNGKSADVATREDDDAEEYIDYQLMNPEDEYFDRDFDQNGDLKTVTGGHPQTGDYHGHSVDGINEDEVSIYLSGSTGNTIARTLDKNGLLGADYDDESGEHTNGLVEWNPKVQDDSVNNSDLDDITVYTRDPVLREDLDWEANGGGFIAMLWDIVGKSYDIVVGFNDFDGANMEAATLIEPTVNNSGFDDPDLRWHNPPLDEKASVFSDGGENAGNFSNVGQHEQLTYTTYDDAPTDIKEVAHHVVVGMELQPGQDPLEMVNDVDGWVHDIDAIYDGSETVDETFGEMIADVTMDYASMVDGDFQTARDAGFAGD